MTPELDAKLCAEYPRIFRDRYAPMDQTAMCWGPECGNGWYHIIEALCGIIQSHIDHGCRDRAWALRYNRALRRAQAGDTQALVRFYAVSRTPDSLAWAQTQAQRDLDSAVTLRDVPEAPAQVVATQVKEKYGTLRFYVDYADDYVRGAIALAEHLSARTCETCGAAGKLRGDFWLSTRCDEHA